MSCGCTGRGGESRGEGETGVERAPRECHLLGVRPVDVVLEQPLPRTVVPDRGLSDCSL